MCYAYVRKIVYNSYKNSCVLGTDSIKLENRWVRKISSMSSVLYWTHAIKFVEEGRIIVNIEYTNKLKSLWGETDGNKTRRN